MDSSVSRLKMEDAGMTMLSKTVPSRPCLSVPPRNSSAEALLRISDDATPSPMTFVSSLFAEDDPYSDCKSFSHLLAGAMASPTIQMGEGLIEFGVPAADSNGGSGMTTGGGFAERLAARRAGNKEQGSPGMPSRLPIPRSPYFTVPSGLSPTTLLDSPLLLPTSQAEPSPTTGSFFFPPFVPENGSRGAVGSVYSNESSSEQDDGFVFKPYPNLAGKSLPPFASTDPSVFSHQQVLAQAHKQVSSGSAGAGTSPVSVSTSISTSVSSLSGPNLVSSLQSIPPLESTAGPMTESSVKAPSSQGPNLPHSLPHLVERPSEDGYNWRKYGQKQVKGSEYPRSYYKCTHPNCPVKKKVERSHDGQITEIVYKSEHNHARPQATRRLAVGGNRISDAAGREASHSTSLERGENGNGVGKGDDEINSTELSSSSRGLAGTPEPSLGSTSDDEGEDGEASRADEDEPDSKRRRTETGAAAPLRTIREPRVVVQTTSEVDILDDGYRWRKYGQKVVKGNTNPRSYYKCTNLGCRVRKHVERSSKDSQAVITTYEGKHNHDVPAARNSNHDTSGTPPLILSHTTYEKHNYDVHAARNNSCDATGTTGTAFSPSAGPFHTGLGVSTSSTVPKTSPSLQEQFFGKFLEDTYKFGDKRAVRMELGSGAFVKGATAFEQNIGQGTDVSAKSTRSVIGSGLNGVRPLEGCDFLGQNVGLRPKLEPGDVQPLQHSIESLYAPNSSSFITRRLLLGP